ncbi:MAG: NAD(P)-dependent oxidoreductase, partial [Cocleimonas sp.]
MKYFPLFLDINKRHCLVIGGGLVASRKVKSLLKSGALVTLISPVVSPALQQLAEAGKISILLREYQSTDIIRAFLVIAATNNADVNIQIADQANDANILVNVADNPDLGSFIFPSVVDRSPVTVAISTGGASPVFARQLRMRLDTMIPKSAGALASITEEYREKVKQTFSNTDQRKEFWETALNGVFAEYVYAGNETQARNWLDDQLSKGESRAVGEVYLVGAGPGDPDLLTFKAVRLMQQADVMVYDRLVSKAILDMANKDAERLYVGKEKSNHAV